MIFKIILILQKIIRLNIEMLFIATAITLQFAVFPQICCAPRLRGTNNFEFLLQSGGRC